MITDLTVIARLSELDFESNTEFRTFLRHQLLWTNEELDALVQELDKEVTAAIDCTACGNCCRELCISVEAEDIERLAKRLGISSSDFESRYVAVDDDDSTEKFMPESPCPFLGGCKCTVYEDRPKVCREFPHLYKNNFRSRLLGVFDTASECPIVFNVLEELKRRANWLR